jgi:hypothetical protein
MRELCRSQRSPSGTTTVCSAPVRLVFPCLTCKKIYDTEDSVKCCGKRLLTYKAAQDIGAHEAAKAATITAGCQRCGWRAEVLAADAARLFGDHHCLS